MKTMKKDISYTEPKEYSKKKLTVVPLRSPQTKKNRPIAIRDSLLWFSEKMEADLQASDQTASAWETEAELAILDDLDNQITKLRAQLRQALQNTQPEAEGDVIEQCVQVANLAHMIASCHHPMLRYFRKGKAVS